MADEDNTSIGSADTDYADTDTENFEPPFPTELDDDFPVFDAREHERLLHEAAPPGLITPENKGHYLREFKNAIELYHRLISKYNRDKKLEIDFTYNSANIIAYQVTNPLPDRQDVPAFAAASALSSHLHRHLFELTYSDAEEDRQLRLAIRPVLAGVDAWRKGLFTAEKQRISDREKAKSRAEKRAKKAVDVVNDSAKKHERYNLPFDEDAPRLPLEHANRLGSVLDGPEYHQHPSNYIQRTQAYNMFLQYNGFT